MTSSEGLDHVFTLIWNSNIKTSISGVVRRYLRPTNSDKEDVTVNVLNIDFDQLQEGIINVNVFVPNPEYTAIVDGKTVRLRDIPNQSRIIVLSTLFNVLFKMNYDKENRVLAELSAQHILTEKDQTIINNRIKLTIKNL